MSEPIWNLSGASETPDRFLLARSSATAIRFARHRAIEGRPVLLAGCWAYAWRDLYDIYSSFQQPGFLNRGKGKLQRIRTIF
jgi:hypothetical protein